MIHARYNTPDNTVLEVKRLRFPHLAAYVNAFVVGEGPNGKYLLLDRTRVVVGIRGEDVPLDRFLAQGGKLTDIE